MDIETEIDIGVERQIYVLTWMLLTLHPHSRALPPVMKTKSPQPRLLMETKNPQSRWVVKAERLQSRLLTESYTTTRRTPA